MVDFNTNVGFLGTLPTPTTDETQEANTANNPNAVGSFTSPALTSAPGQSPGLYTSVLGTRLSLVALGVTQPGNFGDTEALLQELQSQLADKVAENTSEKINAQAEEQRTELKRFLAALTDVTAINESIATEQGKLQTVQSDLGTARGELTGLTNTRAGKQDRLDTVNTQIKTLEGVEDPTDAQKKQLQDLKTEQAKLTGEISSLTDQIGDKEAEIGELEEDERDIQGTISGLQSQLQTALLLNFIAQILFLFAFFDIELLPDFVQEQLKTEEAKENELQPTARLLDFLQIEQSDEDTRLTQTITDTETAFNRKDDDEAYVSQKEVFTFLLVSLIVELGNLTGVSPQAFNQEGEGVNGPAGGNTTKGEGADAVGGGNPAANLTESQLQALRQKSDNQAEFVPLEAPPSTGQTTDMGERLKLGL
ncbi:MAG: hypothetical protein AAFS07_07210 [Pseudomonadota bacterium]